MYTPLSSDLDFYNQKLVIREVIKVKYTLKIFDLVNQCRHQKFNMLDLRSGRTSVLRVPGLVAQLLHKLCARHPVKSVSQTRGSSSWGRGTPLTQGMLPWLLLHLAPVASFSCNCPPLSLLRVVSWPPGCPNSTSFFSPSRPPLSFL